MEAVSHGIKNPKQWLRDKGWTVAGTAGSCFKAGVTETWVTVGDAVQIEKGEIDPATKEPTAKGKKAKKGGSSKAKKEEAPAADADPDALPFSPLINKSLTEAGFPTLSSLENKTDDELTALKGIKAKALEAIREHVPAPASGDE